MSTFLKGKGDKTMAKKKKKGGKMC